MKKIILYIMLPMVVFLTACGNSDNELSYDSISEIQYSTDNVSVSDTEKSSEITFSETEEYTESETAFDDYSEDTHVEYYFRTESQLNQHFQKHGGEFGDEFGYETAEDYEQGASDVINSPDALYKTEAEDGDGVYYIESTNEFVILSTDGYIRTYFRPSAGKNYFDRQ